MPLTSNYGTLEQEFSTNSTEFSLTDSFFYSVSQDTDKDIIANLLETAGKQDSTSTGFYNPQISQSSTPAQTEPLPLRSQKLTILEKRNPVFSKEKDDLLKALDFLD